MMKSIVIHDISMSDIAAMERWYFRDHAPEIVRHYGPWLPAMEVIFPWIRLLRPVPTVFIL